MAVRILIADQDQTLLASYQARLSQDGFEVRTVTNGLDCLDALRKFVPNVLVLEPEMPWGGDGVLDVMHSVLELPLVPVFIVTSRENFARLDARKFVEQFPLVTHLQTKPVRPDELARLIRRIANEPRPLAEDLCKSTPSPGNKGRRARVKEGRTTFPDGDPLIGVSHERATSGRTLIERG